MADYGGEDERQITKRTSRLANILEKLQKTADDECSSSLASPCVASPCVADVDMTDVTSIGEIDADSASNALSPGDYETTENDCDGNGIDEERRNMQIDKDTQCSVRGLSRETSDEDNLFEGNDSDMVNLLKIVAACNTVVKESDPDIQLVDSDCDKDLISIDGVAVRSEASGTCNLVKESEASIPLAASPMSHQSDELEDIIPLNAVDTSIDTRVTKSLKISNPEDAVEISNPVHVLNADIPVDMETNDCKESAITARNAVVEATEEVQDSGSRNIIIRTDISDANRPSVPDDDLQNKNLASKGECLEASVCADAQPTGSVSSAQVVNKGRSSRRKQQKTRKVVESDDEEIRTVDSFMDADLVDYAPPVLGTDASPVSMQQLPEPESTSPVHIADDEPPSSNIENTEPVRVNGETDGRSVDEHELEGFLLPEGTVFVLPEAAESSSSSVPEIGATRHQKSFKTLNAIINCTACNKQLGTDHSTDLHRHPVLKVLICRKCYNTYNDATIEKDADGSDEQCRWCVQGGDLICCDFCSNALCKGCIRRNFGRKELGAILNSGDDVKWKCYICDPRPMLSLIEHCSSVMEALAKQERKQTEHDRRKRTVDGSRVGGSSSGGGGQPVPVIQSSHSMSSSASATKLRVNQPLKTPGNRSTFQTFGQKKAFASARQSIAPRGAPTRFAGPNELPAVSPGRMKVFLSSAAVAPRSAEQFAQPLAKRARESLPMNVASEQTISITLDRLLSATQSMGLFLNSLTNELRSISTVSSTGVLVSQTSKRKEVAGKLWRAYRAYSNSFQEIGSLGGLLKPTIASEPRPSTMIRNAPFPTSVVTKRPDGMMVISTRDFTAARSSTVQSVRALSTPIRWTSSSNTSSVLRTAPRAIAPKPSPVSTIVRPSSVPQNNIRFNVKTDKSVVIELSDSEDELIKDAASIASSVIISNRDSASSLHKSTELERYLKIEAATHLNGCL